MSGCIQVADGESVKTQAVCRFCGCGCGVICESRNGKLISVTGDPDNGSNKGLNCVKGYYLAKILYGPDRLTHPLIRDDKRTKGTDAGLREASWDEALDLVATRFSQLRDEHGGRSIAAFACSRSTNADVYLFEKMARTALRSNNIDSCARV